MRPKERYQTVEMIVPVNFTGPQVNFKEVAELRSDSDRDVLIFSIAVSSASSVPNSPSGNPTATDAQLANAFLTLYVLGTQRHFNVPLSRYLTTKGNGAAYFSQWELFETKPLRIDWSKSFVSFGAPLVAGPQFSFLFEFSYEWYPPGTYVKYCDNLDQLYKAGVVNF